MEKLSYSQRSLWSLLKYSPHSCNSRTHSLASGKRIFFPCVILDSGELIRNNPACRRSRCYTALTGWTWRQRAGTQTAPFQFLPTPRPAVQVRPTNSRRQKGRRRMLHPSESDSLEQCSQRARGSLRRSCWQVVGHPPARKVGHAALSLFALLYWGLNSAPWHWANSLAVFKLLFTSLLNFEIEFC